MALALVALTLSTAVRSAKESFIVQPKPKKESRNALLEDIASVLIESTQVNAQLIERLAHIEQLLLKKGSQLLTQDKNSIWNTASIEQLQKFRSTLQDLVTKDKKALSERFIIYDNLRADLMC